MSEVNFSQGLDDLCARILQEERESTIYHILSEKFTLISLTGQSPEYTANFIILKKIIQTKLQTYKMLTRSMFM